MGPGALSLKKGGYDDSVQIPTFELFEFISFFFLSILFSLFHHFGGSLDTRGP